MGNVTLLKHLSCSCVCVPLCVLSFVCLWCTSEFTSMFFHHNACASVFGCCIEIFLWDCLGSVTSMVSLNHNSLQLIIGFEDHDQAWNPSLNSFNLPDPISLLMVEVLRLDISIFHFHIIFLYCLMCYSGITSFKNKSIELFKKFQRRGSDSRSDAMERMWAFNGLEIHLKFQKHEWFWCSTCDFLSTMINLKWPFQEPDVFKCTNGWSSVNGKLSDTYGLFTHSN